MKRQHILVVGDSERAIEKLPLVDADNHHFSYCAGDSCDSELIRSGFPFDWILFDGSSLHSDQMDLIRSLRTIGFFYSGVETPTHSGCQLEWSEQGILELHCCMRPGLQQTAVKRSDEAQDGCVFEFHGPMKRTG